MTIASMFKALKWIGLALAIVVGVLAIYVATTWNRTWETPLPDVHASSDPAIITRGEYLVFGPAHCVECHVASSQAFERFAETKQPQPLSGGMAFPAPPLGTVYSKNLTPDRETALAGTLTVRSRAYCDTRCCPMATPPRSRSCSTAT
jgi:mono/diheme cytochrome c family protein